MGLKSVVTIERMGEAEGRGGGGVGWEGTSAAPFFNFFF